MGGRLPTNKKIWTGNIGGRKKEARKAKKALQMRDQ
jgi:hypothetical protein